MILNKIKMNSKLFHKEEGRLKIENLKNINLSDIINKKKKFKAIQNFNQKKLNKNLDKVNNISKRLNTNQINKNAKISKLSIELFPDKPLKANEDLIKNKNKLKKNLSNRKFYPKKFIQMISELTENNNNNYRRKKVKRTKSFNKNKKEKLNLCKKILEGNCYKFYDEGIPLMDFEISKRKKKILNNTINAPNIKPENKIDNLLFNPKNINLSKPQCLYKGPLKYDMTGDDDIINMNNNHSLFKTFMSRNLKSNKQEINVKENLNKDSQACTFIKYDFNGTMRTKRIFNSTFHIEENDKESENNKIKKEIVTTMNNINVNGLKENNKKRRIFGGIMFSSNSNKAKLF